MHVTRNSDPGLRTACASFEHNVRYETVGVRIVWADIRHAQVKQQDYRLSRTDQEKALLEFVEPYNYLVTAGTYVGILSR